MIKLLRYDRETTNKWIDQLVREGFVESVVRRFCNGNKGIDREEILSQAHFRILNARDLYNDPDPSNFKRYVARLVQNVVYSYLDEQKRHKTAKRCRGSRKSWERLEQQVVFDEDGFDVLDWRESGIGHMLEVRDELRKLEQEMPPSPYRKPFELYHAHGLSYKEISERLNIPVGTVMSRLHRARKHLGLA